MEEHDRDTVTEEDVNKNDESEHIEVIDSEEKTVGSEEENLDSQETVIAELKQEKDETQQRLLRLQAEFDNFKKRSQKEKEATNKYKSQDLVSELLPALDNFERALQVEVSESNSSLIEGITMVYQQLKDALTSQGIEEIETKGKPFDPNLHHAVMQVEDEEFETNTVVEELQKGYLLKDRVIRAAMVKVNK
ncbi:molecular chaperone GrpE [Virgibacillus natechei]|uniref:Protein GrpE n=1 Tax=Virgibacillus natechei TaxID=1216297 RepID=A0ABS4ICP3_9BACI|nr:nucleotide exchange factor GrpE [Virgibacillus natechei]MBP1968716.1 molecular chaperone GrpE [Virgibacillus natechei]UZD11518.1 nucleotide exchange factor GrpE [Virgibacillus natechei]